MPRVHEQKAGKDYPEYGIKKGDTYYWWKFRYGGKHKSLKRPLGSQLTQRDEISQLRQAQEVDLKWEPDNREGCVAAIEDMVSLLEGARDAAQEKYDNLPENFQQAEQGQNMENFTGECDATIDELENIKSELEDDDTSFEDIQDPNDVSWPDEF